MKSKIFIKKHLTMIKHTFLDKCNTIIKGSENNTGLNPVAELNAGDMVSRILLHFNVNDMKKSVEDGELNTKTLSHVLKMKNCGSACLPIFNETIEDFGKGKTRASSFDVIVFKIPQTPLPWDEGRGFDYYTDLTNNTNKHLTTEGSNWYRACGGTDWDEEGVYSRETLESEYKNNFGTPDSFIITRQHFDTGMEDLEIDITDFVNNVLLGKEENYGLGLAFTPRYEKGSAYEPIPNIPEDSNSFNTLIVDKIPDLKVGGCHYIKKDNVFYRWFETRNENRFISFFTHHTNTFFHPYLETTDSNVILDDRAKFHIGTTNKLYFFTSSDEGAFNLDVLPTCTIEGKDYEVKQAGKGVYYAEISMKKGEMEPDSILADIWGNIVLNGQKMDDVEMEFVVLPLDNKYTLGKHRTVSETYNLVPQISGIADNEKIKIGDRREIKVDFIKEYSYGEKHIPSSAWYRVYVKENNREIDIYPYHPIERRYDEHFIYVDSLELIPNKYHVDIMVNQNGKPKYYENCLEFTIVDNVTKYYI